jgi:taurine--2-oxoglutarate transaminase
MAFMAEPVVGATAGAVPAVPGYFRRIREICDRYGVLLILDEVMAGFGRTGRWFACEHWDVVPDILVVAKGINSGYVPLGAMVVRTPIREWLEENYFAGGLTYSGHPLACAAGVASIGIFKEEHVVENAAAMGVVLGPRLAALEARHPSIGEVRGLGLFWGLELVRDRAMRQPLVPFNAGREAAAPMTSLVRAAAARGLFLMTHFNVLMVCPPLTITSDELDEGLVAIDEILAIADEYVTG